MNNSGPSGCQTTPRRSSRAKGSAGPPPVTESKLRSWNDHNRYIDYLVLRTDGNYVTKDDKNLFKQKFLLDYYDHRDELTSSMRSMDLRPSNLTQDHGPWNRWLESLKRKNWVKTNMMVDQLQKFVRDLRGKYLRWAAEKGVSGAPAFTGIELELYKIMDQCFNADRAEDADSRSDGRGRTFFNLQRKYEDVLNKYCTRRQGIFTKEHIAEWEELSSSLDPAESVENRAKALAFILKDCASLLWIVREGNGSEQFGLLENVRYMLWHACMDDHSDYTPLHCRCFEYYGECVAALDEFADETGCLLKVSTDAEVNWEEFQRLMHETGTCMLRSWSMIRSQDSSMHEISPALREKYWSLLETAKADPTLRENYRSLASPGVDPDKQRFFDIMMNAHQMFTQHICQLATDLLKGMTKNAKPEVNKVEALALLDNCEKLMEGTVSTDEITDVLRGVLKVARESFGTANPGVDKNVVVNARLKAGAATLPQLRSIDAAWLDPERQKSWNEKRLSDLHFCRQLNHTQFCDAASGLIFSAMPSVHAIYWLLFLGPDAGAAGGQEPSAFVKELHSRLHSRLQENSGPERRISGDNHECAGHSKSSDNTTKKEAMG